MKGFLVALLGLLTFGGSGHTHRAGHTRAHAARVASNLSAVTPTPRPSAFVHPGVLMNRVQINDVASQISGGEETRVSALSDMLQHDLASRTAATPVATVACDGTSSGKTNPAACSDERNDASAAYLNALAWIASGDQSRAQRAISFMNAWAGKLKAHTGSNAPVQAGWAGAIWARTAELIRYTDAGWSSSDITRFSAMLRDVYLPDVIVGAPKGYNGNWDLVMMEAAVGISIFLDDQASYNTSLARFLDRVPAYIFMKSDGQLPHIAASDTNLNTDAKLIKYWNGQTDWMHSGVSQESCRDFEHTGYGLASISHVAEMSRLQGRDLFKEDVGKRLLAALELHTQAILESSQPSWLCEGDSLSTYLGPVSEIGYNALANRLGKDMPYTKQYTEKMRPGGYLLFFGWETLTHLHQA
ncbi:hypothetical protein LCI18_001830 [Fusarium solani-melongenae]|uniref:Uncharacterized protein n=1 Tax=Fusarium solani subsp. cucurbitae TaxID=2747967 RepID=A0ACD3YPS2_FUSSC|nr:hypothetical protein LCI18_001830 [Fusarium solani-melongenae]